MANRGTVLALGGLVLAFLLISLSIQSLVEVPPLGEFKRPALPFQPPTIELPINVEETRLDIPELDLGCQDPEPVLRIKGAPGTPYLRLQAYDQYYSGEWDSTLRDSVEYHGETLDLGVELWSDYQIFNITLQPLTDTGEYLPTPPNPLHLNLTDPLRFLTEQQVFQVEGVPGAYEVEYILYEYSEALLNASKVEALPEYLEVPEYLEPSLRDLAQTIVNGTTTDYEALKALEEYLETYYEYNLSAGEPPLGVDPLEWFLFQSGEGVCSHFNTALVMLARSLGFSARLAGGYYVDPFAEEQLVYPIQSHAFAEVPFQDLGWIIFDATPSATMAELVGNLTACNLTEICEPGGVCQPGEGPVEVAHGLPPGEPVFNLYGPPGSPYLRDGVWDLYNGSWWMAWERPLEYGGEVIVDVDAGANRSEFSFIVEPLEPLQGMLPGPQKPVQLTWEGPLLYYPSAMVFEALEPVDSQYHATGAVDAWTPEELDALEPANKTLYLGVPEGIRERLTPLALEAVEGAPTPYRRAQALAEYLRTHYQYNTSAREAPEGWDPVVWFLEEEGQGQCIDFASAFTLLARCVGLPSRLVTGWLVDPYAEAQVVLDRQAHAYSEVLFQDAGWLVFDATPMGVIPVGPGSNASEPGLATTYTNITHQDGVVLVGGNFTVAGVVVDGEGAGVDGLEVLIYVKRAKNETGVLVGKDRTQGGVFNATCLFPPTLEPGEYLVQAHTLGGQGYNESWSDPPLTAYSESAVNLTCPREGVAGWPFNVSGVLYEAATGRPLEGTRVRVVVGGDEAWVETGEGGVFTAQSVLGEGVNDVGVSWGGEGFTLGVEAGLQVEGLPLVARLPSVTEMTRGTRAVVRGFVEAGGVRGAGEGVTLELWGVSTSTVANEAGEFFFPVSVPGDAEVGEVQYWVRVESSGKASAGVGVVKSRTRLQLEAPSHAQAGGRLQAKATLLDDLGNPLAGEPLNISVSFDGETQSKTAVTDEEGKAQVGFQTPREAQQATLKAVYQGGELYHPSTQRQVVALIQTTPYPVLPLAAAIATAGGLGLLLSLQRKKEVAEEAPPPQDVNNHSRLSLVFPAIEEGLPLVWGLEPLEVEAELETLEGSPLPSRRIVFKVDGEQVHEAPTDGEGRAGAVLELGLGPVELEASAPQEGLKARAKLRIVDYREEIVRLFNQEFSESQDRFKATRPDLTARELYEALKEGTPREAHQHLWEMVQLFEEAKYSLHPIDRSHYTRYIRASQQYRRALSGEES